MYIKKRDPVAWPGKERSINVGNRTGRYQITHGKVNPNLDAGLSMIHDTKIHLFCHRGKSEFSTLPEGSERRLGVNLFYCEGLRLTGCC